MITDDDSFVCITLDGFKIDGSCYNIYQIIINIDSN